MQSHGIILSEWENVSGCAIVAFVAPRVICNGRSYGEKCGEGIMMMMIGLEGRSSKRISLVDDVSNSHF